MIHLRYTYTPENGGPYNHVRLPHPKLICLDLSTGHHKVSHVIVNASTKLQALHTTIALLNLNAGQIIASNKLSTYHARCFLSQWRSGKWFFIRCGSEEHQTPDRLFQLSNREQCATETAVLYSLAGFLDRSPIINHKDRDFTLTDYQRTCRKTKIVAGSGKVYVFTPKPSLNNGPAI